MSTFDGYFHRQFGRSVRADRFTEQDEATRIQLLSHCHADHVVGLSSGQFRGHVYCSEATRDILLRTATASERVHADVHGVKSEDYYTFANLNGPVFDARGKQVVKDGKKLRLEVLKVLALDKRHDFTDAFGSPLCITLLDANHCPGAVMFLIESPTTAILYTGDVRAESFLINSLVRNPVLSDYLATFGSQPRRTIDQIYLDTSAVMTRSKILQKREGVEEALKLFDLFPSNTRFFLNTWTWGYEELLRGVAHKYRTRIHLDDYKARIYSKHSVSTHDAAYSSVPAAYPSLASLGTSTFTSTRFHACERRWKCAHVRGEDAQGCYDSPEGQAIWEKTNEKALLAETALKDKGLQPLVVFVNPSEATRTGWETYRRKIEVQTQRAKRGLDEWPTNLIVPLARHSTLPELQDLVALFRPRSIFPNTIYPEANGADYLSLSHASFFGRLLAPGGHERLRLEAEAHVRHLKRQGKRAARYLPDAADEESQGAREEMMGKFATVAGKLGPGFLRDNFDHLQDAGDLELLMAADEGDPSGEDQGNEASQDVNLEEEGYTLGQTDSRLMRGNAKTDIISKDRSLSETVLLPAPRLSPSSGRSSASARASETRELSRQPAAAEKGIDSHACASTPTPLAENTFLSGYAFYICSSAVQSMEEEWYSRIEEYGGTVLPRSSVRASMETALGLARVLICQERQGWVYEVAVDTSKTIGNCAWLAKILASGRMLDPAQNLAYLPYPAGPVKAFKEIVISSTGFPESQKAALKELVQRLGAKYSPDFVKSETDVLVASDFDNRKCTYAKKWKVPLVNVHWLEDCYVQEALLPMVSERYTTQLPASHRVGVRSDDATVRPAEGLSEEPTGHRSRLPLIPFSPASAKSDPSNKRPRPPSVSLSPAAPRAAMHMHKRQKSGARQPVLQSPGQQQESWKTVLTSNEDNTQQIRHVKEAIRRGAGIPRLKSTEDM